MSDDRPRRKNLTPMSGELKAQEDWSPTGPVAEPRRARKKKALPVTPGQVLWVGLKRTALILLILVDLVAAAALVLVHFAGMEPKRALTLAFFLGGSAIALGGFLGATTGPSADWMPIRGYDAEDKRQGMNSSVIYGVFGVLLILVGAVLDAKL